MIKFKGAYAVWHNEDHCAELRYVYCRSAEYLRSECHECHDAKYIFEWKLVLSVVSRVQGGYAGYHNEDHCAEWHYAYCHSAVRLRAECHGVKYIFWMKTSLKCCQ